MAVTVHFVQDDGAEKVVSGAVGETLMEVGREQTVAGILGDCGGGASSASCHVSVDPQCPARTGMAAYVQIVTLAIVQVFLCFCRRLSSSVVIRSHLDCFRFT